MRNGMIAIIPARSGSKGLADKNIRMCAGRQLMSYSIQAAVNAGIFDCVHVSTDSERYAEIARKYGADVPFLRSESASSDDAGTWDAVIEALDRYQNLGNEFETVMLLQPTSPLRTEDDIIGAFSEYRERKAKAVVSVCEVEHSPLWCNTLPPDFSMEGFITRENEERRQRLDKYYRLNGAIYIVDTGFLRYDQMIYRKGCYAYIMEQRKSVDIDTEEDFELAEYLLKNAGGCCPNSKIASSIISQFHLHTERRCA